MSGAIHILLALAELLKDAYTPPAASRLFSLAAGGNWSLFWVYVLPCLLVLDLITDKEGSSCGVSMAIPEKSPPACLFPPHPLELTASWALSC